MFKSIKDPSDNEDTSIVKPTGATLTLEQTLKVGFTEFHLSRIRRIDAEDFTGVKQKVADFMLQTGVVADPKWLDEGILALKQYYAVALLDTANEHAISEIVDPFWHAHILHTHEYIALSNEVFGEYMHHVPLDKSDIEECERIKRLYRYTAELYPQMFSYINEDFYPLTPSEEVLDKLLICFHGYCSSAPVLQAGLFPKVDMMQYD